MKPVEVIKDRPAETATPITTVFAVLIAKALGIEDADTILYMAFALSFVPAIVTWTVVLVRRGPNGTTYQPPSDS
jgi:hypothetical protein